MFYCASETESCGAAVPYQNDFNFSRVSLVTGYSPITDWEEVDTERLIWNDDGGFDIPTFNISEIVCHLERFKNSEYSFLFDDLKNPSQRYYLPVISDPTSLTLKILCRIIIYIYIVRKGL